MKNRRKRLNWTADLKWFLLFLALAQAGIVVFMDWRGPQLRDLEYAARLALLRQRQAEAPERPLCLVVGSSRLTMGFLPQELPPLRSSSGDLVLPFNFSHLAAGPVMNLVELHRLIREGIRPRWVILEFGCSAMNHEGPSMGVTMSAAGDLPVLARYFSPVKVFGVYVRCRLNPWYSNRLGILRQYAPCWATDAGGEDGIRLDPLGGDDGWLRQNQIDPETRRKSTAAFVADWYDRFQHYQIDPMCDRAFRETLQFCRHEGIDCVAVITPESSEFRSCYSAESQETIRRYCAGIREDYDAPVIDARAWVPDDQFADGHHPLRSGAQTFTERLGRDVVRPLVEGRLRGRAAQPLLEP